MPGIAAVTRGPPDLVTLVERRVERPVEAGRDHEQGLVEERHHAADLVQRRDRLDAQGRGVPQER